MKSKLSIVAAIALLSCGAMGCNRSEVAACNSQDVTNTILANTFLKVKDLSLQAIASVTQDEQTREFTAILQNWSASIENIRQDRYDKDNDTRYCAGTFVYKNMPSQMVLMGLAADSTVSPYLLRTCGQEVSYKVQPLMDKKGQFNVSWECR